MLLWDAFNESWWYKLHKNRMPSICCRDSIEIIIHCLMTTFYSPAHKRYDLCWIAVLFIWMARSCGQLNIVEWGYCCLHSRSPFIKLDQCDPWIKELLGNALLVIILSLQLQSFETCEKDKPSPMVHFCNCRDENTGGFVQERRNSSALAKELRLSCIIQLI